MRRPCILAACLLAAATSTAIAQPASAPDFTGAAPARTDVDQGSGVSDGSARIEPMQVVTFGLDSSALDGTDQAELATVVRWMVHHPDVLIVIEGQTDALGSIAYNAGLATRRAAAVRDALVDAGADPGRLVVAVIGEGRASGTNAAERRAIVYPSRLPLGTIISQTLHRGFAVVWG